MLRTERHSARMSKIKNGGLEQYGTEPFKQQQFGPAGIERLNQKLACQSQYFCKLYTFAVSVNLYSHLITLILVVSTFTLQERLV